MGTGTRSCQDLGEPTAVTAPASPPAASARSATATTRAASPVAQTSTVAVFAALGDPNRQALLGLLADRGRASASSLTPAMSVSRQAVNKHLDVLERAGLVESARSGREVLYSVRRDELDRSAEWLHELASQWDQRLATIKSMAETPDAPSDVLNT